MNIVASPQLKIDLGCGAHKRPGYIGLDVFAGEGVDHVLDLTRDRFPFEDGTVDGVYSSHFFEHIGEPTHVLREVGRVCRDGARIEIWTPYAFSNEAFIHGHVTFYTEEPWIHICCDHRDFWANHLPGRWLLRNVNYVVRHNDAEILAVQGFSVGFAVRYLKGVVAEFCVTIEYQRDQATPAVQPMFTYSYSREGHRYPVTTHAPTWLWRGLVRLRQTARGIITRIRKAR